MKKAKKMIAMLLVLVMSVGLFPIMALADEPAAKELFNVVTFGSKTATGYGLSDYGQATRDGEWYDFFSGSGNSFGVMDNASASSYVKLMKTYLNSSLLNQLDVRVKNLCFEGMRADELRAILDPDYTVLAEGKHDVYLRDKLGSYTKWFNANKNMFDNMTLENYAQQAVVGANVIILDFAMENFYSYLIGRLQAIFGLGGYKKEDYSETVAVIEAQLGFDASSVETTIKDLIKHYIPSNVQLSQAELDAIVEALVYCYCDFRLNFDRDIELIRDLNKTAKIIVVSGYNALNGLKLDFGGDAIDMSALWLSLTSLVNTYITTGEHASNYFYANMSGSTNTFFQELSLAGKAADVSTEFTYALAEQAMNYNGILAPGTAYVTTAKMLAELRAKKAAMEASETRDANEYRSVCNSIDALDNATFRSLETQAQGVVESYIKAAKITTIDAAGAREILKNGETAVKNAIVKAAFDWNNAGSAEKAVLQLNARFHVGNGMGICPDADGCRKAYDAVRNAYTKVLPASSDKESNIIGAASGAFAGILQIFKTPILQVVSNLFQNFSFDAMFTAIRDRVSNWIVRIFPRVAD